MVASEYERCVEVVDGAIIVARLNVRYTQLVSSHSSCPASLAGDVILIARPSHTVSNISNPEYH